MLNLINRILIVNFDISRSNGLWISYKLDKEEKDLIETEPHNICSLLKDIGAIENYKLRDGELCVRYGLETGYKWFPYDELLFQFELSQYEALRIVENVERDKVCNEAVEKLRSLPDLITDMFHPLNSFV
jgi:hypothetical protein